jgi:hypothetical protein
MDSFDDIINVVAFLAVLGVALMPRRWTRVRR